ncbi:MULTISPECIES: hypothetical protein [unclassified Sphingomonas]|nr:MULTISPECIES: hypothetical protein [unclassified Sphingomonas]
MKRVLMALIAGAVLSGMAAAYASSVRPTGKPITPREDARS